MEHYFKLQSYNKQSLLLFGTQEQADLYRDWLNRDIEVGCYRVEATDLTQDSITLEQDDECIYFSNLTKDEIDEMKKEIKESLC